MARNDHARLLALPRVLCLLLFLALFTVGVVAPPPSPAPPPPPPSCGTGTAGKFLASTTTCTCTSCPSYSTSPAGSTSATSCTCNAGGLSRASYGHPGCLPHTLTFARALSQATTGAMARRVTLARRAPTRIGGATAPALRARQILSRPQQAMRRQIVCAVLDTPGQTEGRARPVLPANSSLPPGPAPACPVRASQRPRQAVHLRLRAHVTPASWAPLDRHAACVSPASMPKERPPAPLARRTRRLPRPPHRRLRAPATRGTTA